jgi:hypothetical protein
MSEFEITEYFQDIDRERDREFRFQAALKFATTKAQVWICGERQDGYLHSIPDAVELADALLAKLKETEK